MNYMKQIENETEKSFVFISKAKRFLYFLLHNTALLSNQYYDYWRYSIPTSTVIKNYNVGEAGCGPGRATRNGLLTRDSIDQT